MRTSRRFGGTEKRVEDATEPAGSGVPVSMICFGAVPGGLGRICPQSFYDRFDVVLSNGSFD
jgi:hypothetical protein